MGIPLSVMKRAVGIFLRPEMFALSYCIEDGFRSVTPFLFFLFVDIVREFSTWPTASAA